jgi:acyl carrier protein
VDLLVKLQEITGRKISPAVFKKVRTVDDVVNQVCALLDA